MPEGGLMPKGHIDIGRQLDALAHVIAQDDIGRVAARWGISPNGVYHLARSAVKRLQRGTARQRTYRSGNRAKGRRAA